MIEVLVLGKALYACKGEGARFEVLARDKSLFACSREGLKCLHQAKLYVHAQSKA